MKIECPVPFRLEHHRNVEFEQFEPGVLAEVLVGEPWVEATVDGTTWRFLEPLQTIDLRAGIWQALQTTL